jgi:hypothetical protein
LVFLLLIGGVIFYLIYAKYTLGTKTDQEDIKIKIQFIKPEPKYLKYFPDFVNYFFSIRELYFTNPNAFYSVVDNVDQFLYMYDTIMNKQVLYCKQNLEVMEGFARTALNNFNSLIYVLNSDKNVTKKFHLALKDLHVLLYQYINRVIDKCNALFTNETINVNSGFYEQFGPRPINYFTDWNDEQQYQYY